MSHDSHVVSVLRETGCTYRQLDYWTRTGRLKAHLVQAYGNDEPLDKGGSGTHRLWPRSEVETAALMRRLIEGGLDLQPAHDHARKIMASGFVEIAPGVLLVKVDTGR